MNTRIRISLVICLCLFCALGTWGQNARLATLKGLVVDLNDARVPNALVVLTNGVQTYKVRTDEIGEYK